MASSLLRSTLREFQKKLTKYKFKTTPVGFEPTRAEPTGLAGRRLNHSAKVSLRRSRLLFGLLFYAVGGLILASEEI